VKKRLCSMVMGFSFAALSALGCGAAPVQPAAAPSAVSETPSAPPAAESKSREGVPPPPPPAPAVVMPSTTAQTALPAALAPYAGGSTSTTSAFRAAGSDLARALIELQASAGDCRTACRALGSMERATAHLCSLASSSDEQSSCQDARAKVLAGRDRVRTSCGECEGGPSLDRNAPIPSTR